MDKLKLYLYIITVTTFIAVLWVSFFLQIKIDEPYRPTVINGMTSSIGVIVGFSGVVIGMMYREIYEKDHKNKAFYLKVMLVLLLPLTMLWTTYSFLTLGFSELAVRYGLSGLIITLYIFFTLLIYTVKVLNPDKEETSEPEQKKNNPDETKTTEHNKNVNVVVTIN